MQYMELHQCNANRISKFASFRETVFIFNHWRAFRQVRDQSGWYGSRLSIYVGQEKRPPASDVRDEADDARVRND